MSLEVAGLDDLQAYLQRLRTDVPRGAQEGHDIVMAATLSNARPLVPVKTGQLRDSGRIVHRGQETIVEFTAPYAAEVHERTDIPHPNGGQAKFLETAAVAADLGAIDQAMDRAFRS